MGKKTIRAIAMILMLGMTAASFMSCTPTAAPPVAETPAPTAAPQPPPAAPEPSSSNLSFTPGKYLGVAEGLWDSITVEVTVDENSIQDIFVVTHNETGRIMTEIIRNMLPEIRQYQTVGIDTVAGATLSSHAVLAAVENALEKSGVDMAAVKAPAQKDAPVVADETRDVVIVGAGLAGLSTAVSLGRDSDLDILMLEKLDFGGGSATYSGGAMWTRGTEWNEKFNINWEAEDLIELFQSRSGGDPINENLLRRIADVSTGYFEYLIESGAPWDVGNMGSPNTLGHFETKYSFSNVLGATNLTFTDGYSTGIGTSRSVECGNQVATFYEQLALANGAELRVGSKVESLIVENGEVKGVVVNKDGATYNVLAQKVVLATGGFGYNTEYMNLYNAEYAGNVPYCNPGAMGDGITMTKELGTYIVNKGISGSVGVNNPAYGYKRIGLLGSNSPLRINKEGQRIETSVDIRTQTDKLAYSIYGFESHFLTYLEAAVAKGVAVKADTIEALADAVGDVDKAAFIQSIQEYEAASGTAFTAPYYAVQARYTYYNTIAGLKVNDNFQLVNGSDVAIPNLYGVGELVFGNMFSQNYPHIGTSLALATYGGKIVSDEVLKELA